MGQYRGMKILISGASGLIGNELIVGLKSAGHTLTTIVRGTPQPGQYRWDIEASTIDKSALEGVDAIIHLAGENVFAFGWSAKKKEQILQSRVKSTRLLVDAIRESKAKPRAFLCASAIGIYGSRDPGEIIDEASSSGSGFLADVVKAWESETTPLQTLGVRVVNLRFGVVLSPKGGALKQMLPSFKLGLGGRLGSGKQIMSWVALEDAVGAITFALNQDSLSGPINIVSPQPLSNADFTKVLARSLKRPAFFHVPAFALKLLFGQMAEEILLGGVRALPQRLKEVGYKFKFADLANYLTSIL